MRMNLVDQVMIASLEKEESRATKEANIIWETIGCEWKGEV